MRRPVHPAVLFVVVLALAAACGGGGNPEPEATRAAGTEVPTDLTDLESAPSLSTVDACALLTAEDVEAELGQAFTQAEGSGGGTCSYTSQAPLTIVTLVAQPDALAAASFEDTMAAAAGLGDVTELADNAAVEEVEGVGDAAFTLEVAGVPMLYVAHGRHLLAVSVMAELDADGTLVAERSLAETAMSRWP